MEASYLSFDNFTQQQEYQRALLSNNQSLKQKQKHKHSRKHRSHRNKDRSNRKHHRHSHRSKKLSKNYGSVNDQCAVCLDDETELDTRLFPCKHVFHGSCLIEWVRQGENFTCPLCRQQITHFFNLSNNDEINDELISIWNDFYVNIDNEPKKSSKVKAILSSETNPGISKNLDLVIEEPTTKKDEKISISNDVSLEEIAKLKNAIINEGLIDAKLETTPVIDNNNIKTIGSIEDNAKLIPQIEESHALKTDSHASNEDMEDIAVVLTSKVDMEDDVKKIASVWQSTQAKQLQRGEKSKKLSLQSLIPEATFLSLMFDTYVSKSVANSIEQLKELQKIEKEIIISNKNETKEKNNNNKTVLFHENEIRNHIIHLEDDIEYERHLNRINGSISMFEERENEIKVISSKPALKEPIITNEESNENVNVLLNKSENLIGSTLTNMEAGIYAGFGASVATFAVTNHARLLPFALRTTLTPILRETVPGVAMFFTLYEHLKTNAFHCDPNMQSHTVAFFERFISAGVASSLAIVPRTSMNNALKCALPLRFASFFGGFELCKDLRKSYKVSNGNNNELNLFEIASSAAVGGIIASSVHYPVTQMIQQSGINNLNQLALSLTGTNNTIATTTTIASTMNNESTMKSFFDKMYRGYLPHLKTFLPSTIACSCAFEFAKRGVISRKD